MNGRKIVEVESHVVGDAHLVRLRTDDGASGVGQSGCWGYPAAVAQVVDTFIRAIDAGEFEARLQRLEAVNGVVA